MDAFLIVASTAVVVVGIITVGCVVRGILDNRYRLAYKRLELSDSEHEIRVARAIQYAQQQAVADTLKAFRIKSLPDANSKV